LSLKADLWLLERFIVSSHPMKKHTSTIRNMIQPCPLTVPDQPNRPDVLNPCDYGVRGARISLSPLKCSPVYHAVKSIFVILGADCFACTPSSRQRYISHPQSARIIRGKINSSCFCVPAYCSTVQYCRIT